MIDAEIREWVREHRELFVNEELAYNSILSRAFVTSTGHAFNCTSTYVAKEDTCDCMKKLRWFDFGIILDKLLRPTHGCGCCWTDQDQYEEDQRISDEAYNKLRFDSEYLQSMSPLLDMKLLVLSVRNTMVAKWDQRHGKPAGENAQLASAKPKDQPLDTADEGHGEAATKR